ncbi:hypothetical protein A2U01_0076240, partial [Trifolium medium]|nr:hypothetical protein [Trifolium medium]
ALQRALASVYVLEWSLSEASARGSDELADSHQFCPGIKIICRLVANAR